MRDSKKEKKKEIGEREVEKGDIDDIEREREREKRRVRQIEMREIKKESGLLLLLIYDQSKG